MSEPKQPKRGSQWTNSFESQLSDGELAWLRTALLARKPSDKEIIKKMPPWRSGPRLGQPVSAATLSNIRDRLELEDSNTEDTALTASILEELKRETPQLSEQQIDEFGNRVFSVLTIRKRDLKGFVKLRSSLTTGKLEQAKLALAERAEDRQQKVLELEQDKYRDLVAEKLLDAALRQRAAEIAASDLSKRDQIAAMRKAAFADVDALQASGKVVIPKL